MYSSRSFKLSCMDGQVDYPGVQGNVGQTLSCPNEKDCEPSHVNLCLLGTQGCPLICRRSSLFKQLVFGVQSVKVVRKPRKNPATVSSFQIKVAVRGHAHPSPCWCAAGWEDYCYCIFTEFNISILKSGPRNFLGLNHDGPQRIPFCRTLFAQETLEQNFKYQLWVQSSIRIEMVWMFTGQNIKFPTCDRFRTKPRHCVFGLQDRPK